MSTPATLADLLTLLETGATLLLPNARAARTLRGSFDLCQQSRSRAVWEPARSLSWDQWTAGLWTDLVLAGSEQRLLLNSAQENALWRELIAADASLSTLASPDGLAALARASWELAAACNAAQHLRSAASTRDSRTFADWAASFTRLCATRGHLSAALLEDALRQHVQSGALAAPATLHLAGFSEFLPAQESLLTALRERGAEVVSHRLETEAGVVRASAIAATEREELVLAARWIREFLENRSTPGNLARVAVLVPNLAEDRAELEQVFREVLAPELQSVTADLSSAPWEMAGGVPLASLAMIAAALDLVRWAAGPLSIERVSSLLLSPYLAGRAERDATDPTAAARDTAAQFDASILRRHGPLRPELSLAAVATMLDGRAARQLSASGQPPLLWPRNLQRFLERAGLERTGLERAGLERTGDLARRRSFAEWTEFLRNLLRAAGWPGPAEPEAAAEDAAVEAWEGLLDLIATLDFSGRRVPFSVALDALEHLAQVTLFATPPTDAAVQVMPAAESAGQVFDAVVLLRATEANWPSPQHANPLLSWPLQRNLHMPGADAALAVERARAFTADLLARSANVLLTSAAEDRDGPVRPSPLLAEFGLTTLTAADLVSPQPPSTPIRLDVVDDAAALPIASGSLVHGGADVLKLQAACGFRAFAELRLRATTPETIEFGLDARESGDLLHRVLQNFWRITQTQDNLRAMSTPERTALLSRCLDEVLPTARSSNAWDAAYLALQKDRQLALLQPWLEEELRRGPFTVMATEEKQAIAVGPLTLAVRMDRVDQVDGGFFLVDYKTGYAADPKLWEDARPDEPQLPFYALSRDPAEIKGLAFAHLRAGRKMGWNGYQAEPGFLPTSTQKNTLNLPAKIGDWRASLTVLAEDFHAGHAVVDPRTYPQTCAHCRQRLLCRLDPASLRQESDIEAASDARPAAEEDDG